jgi:hypothetical protein
MAKKELSNIVPINNEKAISALAPRNMTEAVQFAELLAQSTFIPDTYRNKKGDVLAAVVMGAELGLAPMQALQNIAVINGRPSVWGDAILALVYNSPLCEYIREEFDEDTKTAICIAKRKGRDEVVREFSWGDASRAGLTNKKGPWQTYPKRMLQQRARGFALRDAFPDVLRGLITREEAEDYDVEIQPKQQRPATPPETKQQPAAPAKDNGQVPNANDQDVIDVEVEPPPKKHGATGPDLGDFLNGVLRTKTVTAAKRHIEAYRGLWVEAFGEDSKQFKMIESGAAKHIERLTNRGKI